MKRLLRFLFIGILAFLTVEMTTFGWNFFTPTINIKPKDTKLADNLKSHVRVLSEEIGDRNIFNYAKLEQAARYITNKLKSYGYNDIQLQQYVIEGKQVSNIIITKIGVKAPQEIVIVGAHYDSCFNPGADDNASGVSGVLELARIFRDRATDRTIKFIFFVNEEPPFFKTEHMGSRVYARKAKKSGENIQAVIAFDLIGYYSNRIFSQRYLPIAGIFFPNKGNFISVIGNFKSRYLVSTIVKSFRKNSKFSIESVALDFIPAKDFSDHWSFWKEGYLGVMISDTAFLRHRNYHKVTDTWEKLNYNDMACVIEGLCPVMIELSKVK